MNPPGNRFVLAFIALACFCTGPELRAQSYPAKPVRVVVPFAPGGSVDLLARLLTQRMAERTGGIFIVDNRAGGGTNIGVEHVARSAPDGYTLLMASSTQAINVSLYPKLNYDIVKDFAPISLVSNNPGVLLVHPSLPVKTVKDLVALAKAKPGALTYASSGSGASSHLAAELLKMSAGIDLVHVPYKGAGPALSALLGGQVEMMITITAGASGYVKSGKLRALAVTSERRTAGMPGVPTMREAGIRDYEVNVWAGLMAPAAARREIVSWLNAETAKALKDLAPRFVELDTDPMPTTSEQFAKYLQAEIAKWAVVVKRSGAKVE